MSDIIIHLTISGLIALQPYAVDDSKWRVTVPDFSAHNHAAFFLVRTADLRPPVNEPEPYTLFWLQGEEITVTGVTPVGKPDFPRSLLTYFEASNVESGPRAKPHEGKTATDVPRLKMTIDGAGIDATWVDPNVSWYLERAKNGRPDKTAKRPIAEEVCLRFVASGPTFKIETKSGKTFEIAANSGSAEIRLNNIDISDDSQPPVDPHFHLYYDVTQDPVPADDRAILKTDDRPGGRPKPGHGHALSLVEITPANVRLGWPIPVALNGSVATNAVQETRGIASLFGPNGKRSMTGSNCPPIGGDKYP